MAGLWSGIGGALGFWHEEDSSMASTAYTNVPPPAIQYDTRYATQISGTNGYYVPSDLQKAFEAAQQKLAHDYKIAYEEVAYPQEKYEPDNLQSIIDKEVQCLKGLARS